MRSDVFRERLVWVPPSNKIQASWLSSTDCVWDGPPWLKSQQRLKSEAYSGLGHLFKVSLGIPDASHAAILDDLLMLKNQSGPTNAKNDTAEKTPVKNSAYRWKPFAGFGADQIFDEAERRYEYLAYHATSPFLGEVESCHKSVQSSFESSALIYIPKESLWRPPSQCVWVESSVKIPGKYSIANLYATKKTFFINVLKVTEPTVDMYIELLKGAAKGKTSATQIKETMILICGLGLGECNLTGLADADFLPIKPPRGPNVLTSANLKNLMSLDFTIVENLFHLNAFEGKINVLDFTLEEIRDTRALLLAMGLEKRFSSKLVEEVTEVTGSSVHSQMSRMLRSKTKAIVRYVTRQGALMGDTRILEFNRLILTQMCLPLYWSD